MLGGYRLCPFWGQMSENKDLGFGTRFGDFSAGFLSEDSPDMVGVNAKARQMAGRSN